MLDLTPSDFGQAGNAYERLSRIVNPAMQMQVLVHASLAASLGQFKSFLVRVMRSLGTHVLSSKRIMSPVEGPAGQGAA